MNIIKSTENESEYLDIIGAIERRIYLYEHNHNIKVNLIKISQDLYCKMISSQLILIEEDGSHQGIKCFGIDVDVIDNKDGYIAVGHIE